MPGGPNFFSRIEIYAADNLVRHICHKELFFEKTGLCIRPVKDCYVFIVPASAAHQLRNFLRREQRFFEAIVKPPETDFITGGIFGP